MAEPVPIVDVLAEPLVERLPVRYCSWPGCARVTIGRHCRRHKPPQAAGVMDSRPPERLTKKAAAMRRSRERAAQGIRVLSVAAEVDDRLLSEATRRGYLCPSILECGDDEAIATAIRLMLSLLLREATVTG
jgi:hypothetical protein